MLICLNCGKKLVKSQKKFCSYFCQHKYQNNLVLEAWKKGEFDGMSGKYGLSKVIRDYMLNKANYACEICGWNEINPVSQKSPLEIHHKDGNYLNTTETNLQVLCPNCHSLTPNHKALNKYTDNDKRDRTGICRRKQYFCIDCGKPVSAGATRCVDCANKAKIQNKPVSREELKKLIKNKTFVDIGKQFGISDNAIRKWCKFYNLPYKKTDIKKFSDKEWELI